MFRLYLKEEGFHPPSDPIYYLLAGDGLYLEKRTDFFTSSTRVEGMASLQTHGERVELNLPHKLPAILFQQAVSFFQRVYQESLCEAIVLLYYDGDCGEYRILAPEQEVTPMRCWYQLDPTPQGWRRVGTIHSHGGIPAIHSHADEFDEAHDDGIHITVGDLGREATVSCDVVVDGKRFPMHPAELIDGTALPQEVPIEWMRRVKAPAPHTARQLLPEKSPF